MKINKQTRSTATVVPLLAFATGDSSIALGDDRQQFGDETTWPDAWLVAAVRQEPPNAAALDALVERHWKTLYGRCHLLTMNQEKALDLAQASWCRLLRARHTLKPDGNFRAYLTTIATNLFRDSYRANRRAGQMADNRLVSLDAAHSNDDGETIALKDIVPDLKSLHREEQTLLAIDLDMALQHLIPHLREVLVARFIEGESCAEIGRRYGRSEQTVSGWVRDAVQQMKRTLNIETPKGPGGTCRGYPAAA